MGNTYTVQKDDNMWKISQATGIPYNKLLEYNSDIKDPNIIHPGQIIKLSADGTVSNTPVSAPTIKPAPTAPKYDTTSWDDTTKGKDASDAYDDAKEAVNKHGPFQYGNMEQYNAVMDKILNREKFSYDFNGDALYQQYKDKYIKQGKMAMGDAIGQASAMTGGYGNSYAQSVGQQAYQAQLENLNDVIPELYSMALDKYHMEGQDLYNQFGMLSEDYNRAYGEHQDGYNKLMDALGIARGDYYDGADMFYTEQTNKNNVLGKEFDDAMSIYNAENENAWKQAAWDEDARRWEIENERAEEAHNAQYGNSSSSGGNKTGHLETLYDGKWGTDNVGNTPIQQPVQQPATASGIPDSVRKKASEITSNKELEDYLERMEAADVIEHDQALQLMAEFMDVNEGVYENGEDGTATYRAYTYSEMVGSSNGWEVLDDGGVNFLGIGIDADARVRAPDGQEYRLDTLRKKLQAEGMTYNEATKAIRTLSKNIGI